MKKFRALDISEKDFVRTLGRQDETSGDARAVEAKEVWNGLARRDLRLLWSLDESQFGTPMAVVGGSSSLEDLLPRMLAQPGVLEPVTSVMRAWDVEDLARMSFGSEREINVACISGIVGLLIAEIYVAAGGGVDLRRCGLDLTRRTFTFTYGLAWAMGMPSELLPELIRRWVEAAELTSNEGATEKMRSLGMLSGFLSSLSKLSPSTWETTPHELARHVQSWRLSVDDRPQADLLAPEFDVGVRELLRLSREARYAAIVELLGGRGRPESSRLSVLERGLLISLIDPGSFDFLEFATQQDSGDGATVFAYGLCAGLLGGKTALSRFNGFGANILVKGFAAPARLNADISLHELKITRRIATQAALDFRTRSASSVDVELMPFITASFSHGGGKRGVSANRAGGMSDTEVAHVEDALRALEFATSVLNELKSAGPTTRGNKRRAGR